MSGDLTLLPDDLADLDGLLAACRRDVLLALAHENPAYSQARLHAHMVSIMPRDVAVRLQ